MQPHRQTSGLQENVELVATIGPRGFLILDSGVSLLLGFQLLGAAS